MNVRECYEVMGGDYEDAKSRLMNDAMIEKFAKKFLNDASYCQLSEAMENRDYDAGFRAAHTLKGISGNLGFRRLGDSVSKLTETLRRRETVPVDAELCESQWKQVTADYNSVIEAIKQL